MLDQAALLGFNHLLQGASWARSRLAPFAGKTARLSLPPLKLDLLVTADGLFEASDRENCDVEIALPADAALLALRGTETVFKAAHISGLAEFADALGFVLRNLRWDYEEDLSQCVGDIAAHRIVGFVTAFGNWHQQARRNLAENIAEYFVEENPTVVNSKAVKALSTTVEQLAGDILRLEQRVARLDG